MTRRYGDSKEHVVAVHQAASAADARHKERQRHDEVGAHGTTAFLEVQAANRRRLQVRVTETLTLDAGELVQFKHDEEDWRALFPPSPSMMQQLIDTLQTQRPPPPDWFPDEQAEGAAVARLAFRWGSYFALIGDSSKPVSSAAGTRCGCWGDSEQARMSIEISSNLATLHQLRHSEPERWRRIVYAAQELPGPPPSDQVAVPKVLMSRLRDGVEESYRKLSSVIQAALGEKESEVSTDTLQKLIKMEDSAEARALFRKAPLRHIWNGFVFSTWRSPLEDYHGVHSGAPELPDDVVLTLDHNRFTPQEYDEIGGIMARAGNGFVAVSDELGGHKPDDLEDLLAFPLTQSESGRKWSVTEHTRPVLL